MTADQASQMYKSDRPLREHSSQPLALGVTS